MNLFIVLALTPQIHSCLSDQHIIPCPVHHKSQFDFSNQKYIEICASNKNIHIHPVAEDQDVYIFDVDECLYFSVDLLAHKHAYIKKIYLSMGRSEQQWEEDLKKYGAYRNVFLNVYKMPLEEFTLKYDISPFSEFITPDRSLAHALSRIKARKFCLTNASRYKAQKTLQAIGLENTFEKIFCSCTLDDELVSKPHESVYEFVENALKITDKSKIHFFDDTLSNVFAARRRGWDAHHVTQNVIECIEMVLSQ